MDGGIIYYHLLNSMNILLQTNLQFKTCLHLEEESDRNGDTLMERIHMWIVHGKLQGV